MSLNKIIIGFIIILILFSAYILFVFNKSAAAPKSKVTIDSHTYSVELATTPAQQQQGLSGRASLQQNQGMLFIFPSANRYPFWMKDMKFPLDMIFINNDKIVAIFNNVPVPKGTNPNLPTYTPSVPANQILEINAGQAKKYGFKDGDIVKETIVH
jgi:uncharacterized membrane protein (UPF0127 family)